MGQLLAPGVTTSMRPGPIPIRCPKVFRILSERYRNRPRRFGLRFNLIAAIYNYELDLIPFAFD